MVVDQARALEAAVEPAGDERRPLGIPRDEHEGRVVARLGMEVDLRHERSLAGQGTV
jgi:hypothetical protein